MHVRSSKSDQKTRRTRIGFADWSTLRFRRCHRTVRYRPWRRTAVRHTIRLGAVVTMLFASSCDNVPIDPPDGTLTGPDTTVNPTDEPALRINAEPIFCCNPLSLDFDVDATDLNFPVGTRYSWDFGDGQSAAGPAVQHTFPRPGAYTVTLVARRVNGGSDDASRTVNVGTSGELGDDLAAPPSVDAPDSPSEGLVALRADAGADQDAFSGGVVLLDGAVSEGPLGTPLVAEWTQTAGPAVLLTSLADSRRSFVAPDVPADELVLTFELEVRQGEASDTDAVNIRVRPRPTKRVFADAGPDQHVSAGAPVRLDGSGSQATGDGEVQFAWTQIEGSRVFLGSKQAATATLQAPSDHETTATLLFELTVVQGTVSDSDQVAVVVDPPAARPRASREQFLAWMRELPPLQKVHYHWPIPSAIFASLDDEMLFEYIRLTHSIGLWGEWAQRDQLKRAVELCRRVNALAPAIPASLSFTFRPWNRVFPPDAPPTYTGPEHDSEIRLIVDRSDLLKRWLGEFNGGSDSPVAVTVILLECERFFVQREGEPDYRTWNAAVDDKHNAAYDPIKSRFPDARIVWYARGNSDLFTLRERGDGFSAPLYQLQEPLIQRALFRRAVEIADLYGVEEVMPWIALGSGYDIDREADTKTWRFDNDYDLNYSWLAGAEINNPIYGDRPDEFAPWHRAPFVAFWPNPWEPRLIDWERHFISYVRGAHGISDLPE